MNIIYNDKNDRLDMPIKEFMISAYKFSELGEAKREEIIEFCNMCAERYATKESKGDLIITHSLFTMEKLRDKFLKLFSIYKGFSCGDPTETRTLKELSAEAGKLSSDKFLTTKRF